MSHLYLIGFKKYKRTKSAPGEGSAEESVGKILLIWVERKT